MTVFTYSKTRANLAKILDLVALGEEIRILRSNGSLFQILPVKEEKSPLDLKPLKTDITREEIISSIHESRRN